MVYKSINKVLCLLAIISGIAAQDPDPFNTTTEGPITTTVPYTTTTSEDPITTVTTTVVPTTTTTTTVEPITTVTTSSPTSTVAPLPPGPPQPVVGTWSVYDPATNVTCIVARFAAAFKVPYTRTDGLVSNGSVVLSPNATVNGTCGEVTQAMSLVWYQVAEGMKSALPNMLTFTFTRNISNDVYYATDITLQSYTDMIYFPNATAPGYILSLLSGSNLDFFPAHVNNSYACRSEQKFYMAQSGPGALDNETTFGSITSMQIQAFRSTGDDNFGTAENCVGDTVTSDIVPIAVGCALAALVAIVLIAYLVGRSRAASRQRGYQSV